MSSFDVLNPKTSVIKPYFLEASAGTGKTFAIEHIVTRLFLNNEKNILVDQVLIVTFTRAATRELKVRIRENLAKVAIDLEQNKASYPYVADLLSDEKIKKRAIEKLQEVLCSYDQIQIFTIHGFCLQMLKEFPFEAGSDLGSSASEQITEEKVYQETLFDYLRSNQVLEKFHKGQIYKILKSCRFEMNEVVKKTIKAIKLQGQIKGQKTYKQSFEEIKQILSRSKKFFTSPNAFSEEFYSLASFFKGVSSLKKVPHQHFTQQISKFGSYFKGETSLEDLITFFFYEEALFFECFKEENLKKTTKKSFRALEAEFEFLSFCHEISYLFEEMMNPKQLLLSLACECREKASKALEYYGITPPDLYLSVMQKKLEKEDFLHKVQNKYKAALIDEFQDTDPIQWSIFKTLFCSCSKGFPLYLVGDPKQSIYGFRNADLPTYLEASSYFSLEDKKTLDTNYRSEPHMIEALNALFSLSSKWLCEKESLLYTKVKYSPFASNTKFEDSLGALHFFGCDLTHLNERGSYLKEIEESNLFNFISNEILKLKNQGYQFKDFAVLIRDRFQSQRLERHLKKRSIPYTSSTSVCLLDTLSYKFFKGLISSIVSEEISSFKQLLSHPFFGFSHHDLKGVLTSKLMFALQKLKDLQKTYLTEGFLSFWSSFLQTNFEQSLDSFERELLLHRSFQDYSDLIQVADLLIEKFSGMNLSHEQLLLFFDELEQKDPENDSSIRRKELVDEPGVKVMTIHKSKGLEFQIVFALGVCSRSSGSFDYIRSDGKEGSSVEIYDELNIAHQEVLSKENSEKMRQLYVALTRAKKRLYVPVCFLEDQLEPNLPSLSAIELFFCRSLANEIGGFKEKVVSTLSRLISHSISYSECANESIKVEEKSSLEEKILEPPIKFSRVFKEIVFQSYSSILKASTSVDSSKDAKSLEVDPLDIPASAETGEVFHKIFEKIFERGLYLHLQEDAIKSLVHQEITSTVLENFEEKVMERVKATLFAKYNLNGVNFEFSSLDFKKVFCEMEFSLFDQNRYLKGVIDLFFEFEGKYYIIDWKTNYLGAERSSYELSSLKSAIIEHQYDLQAAIYTKAAKMLLKKKRKKNAFGGIFYVFIRGVDRAQIGRGVYSFCETNQQEIANGI